MKSRKKTGNTREVALQAKIADLEGDVQDLETTVEAYEGAFETNQEVRTILESRLTTLANELEASRATVRCLESQIGDLKAANLFLQGKLDNERSAARDLTSESMGFKEAFRLVLENVLDR